METQLQALKQAIIDGDHQAAEVYGCRSNRSRRRTAANQLAEHRRPSGHVERRRRQYRRLGVPQLRYLAGNAAGQYRPREVGGLFPVGGAIRSLSAAL